MDRAAIKVKKVKKCDVCRKDFYPFQTTQKVCFDIRCSRRYEKVKKLRKEAREAKVQSRQKDRSEATQKAQSAINWFVRVRDYGKPCISCGIEYGQFHAGHYRTTKAASQLRFNTYNIHAQCAQCNSHKSGNITEYRIMLIDKIGEGRVLELEHDSRARKYSIEYLKRLELIFKKRARLYKRLKGID